MENVNPLAIKRKKRSGFSGFLRYLQRYYQLYLLILPAFVSVVLFSYWPLYGIQIAYITFDTIRLSLPCQISDIEGD